MTGPERAMLYRLAAETGLRSSELRSLTGTSFVLDSTEPTVTVEAAYSKRRRDDVLPVRAETAAELRTFLAAKLPRAPAFNMPSKSGVVRMLRADLSDAEISYRDDAGRVLDFHALRHSFGAALAASGVHPKDAQALMRHSTISLTMDRYTHTSRQQLAAAVSALPDLSAPRPARERAPGTFDTRPDTGAAHSAALPCAGPTKTTQNDATNMGQKRPEVCTQKTPKNAVSGATEAINGEGGIRTPGTGMTQYDGLANRCFQPLSHLSRRNESVIRWTDLGADGSRPG